jgi:predicted metalloprotease with PDZ domain
VRTNHVDSTHAFLTGAALFFYIPAYEHNAIAVTIIPPTPDWQIVTALPPLDNQKNTFLADNFDTLVDSPWEIGIHQKYDFEVDNKAHQWVIWGQGNLEIDRLIEDTQKIIKMESQMLGGLPYEQYFFLLHLSASGFGGLEHKNCCVLNYPRFGFKNQEKYNRFIQLVAHEFFHLWNVKRIRPQALEKFDYQQENYTTSLWFSEGTTSYYDLIIPLRSGIYDRQEFLSLLGKEITQYLNTEGRNIQTLAESSFDAWIKLYRRDAYSNNCQISYYLKGELVTLLLDLLIRNNTDNNKCFDDVMRAMWHKFGKDEIGFSPEELIDEIEAVANLDLSEFFHLYLETTTELPFNQYFEPFGLVLEPESAETTIPYLGITAQDKNITFVDANSPAGQAGIDAGDELLAIDNFRVTGETLNERLENYQAGNMITITIFHQEELITKEVKLGVPQPASYQVKIIDNPTTKQQENLNKWLYSLEN